MYIFLGAILKINTVSGYLKKLTIPSEQLDRCIPTCNNMMANFPRYTIFPQSLSQGLMLKLQEMYAELAQNLPHHITSLFTRGELHFLE